MLKLAGYRNKLPSDSPKPQALTSARKNRQRGNSPLDPKEVPLGDPIKEGHAARSFQEVTETEEGIPIPAEMMHKSNISVWRVGGDSMTEDHLLNGDHLILDKLSTPRNGDLVAASVSKSVAVLRRFYHDEHRIRLEDADNSGESLVCEEREVDILGIVVGILRKYRSSSSDDATKCRVGTKRPLGKA